MNQQLAVQKAPEKPMAFIPFGSKDEIKLSVSIIKEIVCVKTRTGVTCDDKQAMRFMMLCQAQRLNPFAGDAYLIGYDGKNGAEFSLITAHQAFLKRAEVCEEYDGMESGVIIQDKDGDKIEEIEGDFYDAEKFNLLGGWAVVYHKKRKYPTRRKLGLKQFQKPYGVWQTNPAGMIVKCAEADGLRSTFPTLLGGLYTEGETQTAIDISPVVTEVVRQPTFGKVKPVDELPAPAKVEEPSKSPTVPPAVETPDTAAQIVERYIGDEGEVSFDNFKDWLKTTSGVDLDAKGITSYAELTEEIAAPLAKAPKQMKNCVTIHGGK